MVCFCRTVSSADAHQPIPRYGDKHTGVSEEEVRSVAGPPGRSRRPPESRLLGNAMIANSGVYIPCGSAGYETCQPVEEDDFDTIAELIDGRSRLAEWRSLKMRIGREVDGDELCRSDSPWLGSRALVFRQTAIQKLRQILEESGELLPLDCSGEDLAIFNPRSLPDALDEGSSSLTRFDSGRVMMVIDYCFRADVVRGIDAFKMPNLQVSPTFVSHRFIERWRSELLSGLDFRRVWLGEE